MVFLLCVLARPAYPEEHIDVRKTNVSSGCVLFLIQPDESSGNRTEVLHMFDPALHTEPLPVLTVRSNLKLVRRVDRTRFLMETYNTPRGIFLIDVERGTSRALSAAVAGSDGGHPHFLEMLRNRAYFLSSSAKTGSTLMSAEVDGVDPAIPVCDLLLSEVLELTETECWAVSLDSAIYRIPLSEGRPDRIISLEGIGPYGLTHEFSPSRTRLAVGGPVSLYSGKLFIYDLADRKCLLRRDPVSLRLSSWASLAARLQMRWIGDSKIRYSRTDTPVDQPWNEEDARLVWVEEDLTSGQCTAPHPYSKPGLQHRKPPAGPGWDEPESKRSDRLFVDVNNGTCFTGENEPLGMPCGEREISPDGKWAAVLRDGGATRQPNYGSEEQIIAPEVAIADGRARTIRTLKHGWCYGFQWFPDVP